MTSTVLLKVTMTWIHEGEFRRLYGDPCVCTDRHLLKPLAPTIHEVCGKATWDGKTRQCPCPCGQNADPILGAELYPHRPDLSILLFYKCRSCERYVGAHHDGKPKGVPADSVTRQERMYAHKWFDALWKDPRELDSPKDPKNIAPYDGGPLFESRSDAYRWLAEQFGVAEVHIAEMGAEDARRVVDVVRALRGKVLDAGREDH